MMNRPDMTDGPETPKHAAARPKIADYIKHIIRSSGPESAHPMDYPFKADANPIEKSFHEARLLMDYGINAGKLVKTEVRNMYSLGLHLYNAGSESHRDTTLTSDEMLQIDGVPAGRSPDRWLMSRRARSSFPLSLSASSPG